MKKVKIGNDIAVTWSLFKDGEPYSLEGLDLTLYLLHAFGRNKIVPDAVMENNISWTFSGKDQVHTGKYSLEVVINEGQEGMASTDYVDFVQLTQNTPCYEGEDEENVITENIELASSIAFAPVVIKEGGSGLQYSVERTVYLTKGVDAFHFNPPEIFEYEISEEERQYNKETLPLNNAFISIEGLFFHFKENLWSGEETIRATYERISIRDDRFLEELVTLYSNGDAVAELKEIKTGGSETPSDMNSDFSNDF